MGEGGEHLLDGLTFSFKLPSHIAIVGPAGSGKEELTLVLAGLVEPSTGRVTIDDKDLHSSARSRARAAHRLCRQSHHDLRRDDRGQSALRAEVPPAAAAPAGRGRAESRWSASCTRRERSGNSPHDPQADWVDYAAAGIEEPAEYVTSLIRVLRAGAAGRRRVRPRIAQRHPAGGPHRAQGPAARGAAGHAAPAAARAPICRA